MPRKMARLSPLEASVMGVVWELGDCTSAEVIERFAEIRPLAPTTVRTVLTKLREKGYVKQIPSMNRGYKFRAAVSREPVARTLLGEWTSSLFRGAPQRAIACLLDSDDIDEADLDEIRRMIDERKRRLKGGKS